MKTDEPIRLPGPLGELPQDAQARILLSVPLSEFRADGAITARGMATMFKAAKAEYADHEMHKALDYAATAALSAGLTHKHNQERRINEN